MNSRSHKSLSFIEILILIFVPNTTAQSVKSREPTGGGPAVVVDEKLAALRAAPTLDGKLLQRIRRGRRIIRTGRSAVSQGVIFYRVRVSSRTVGWIEREAIVSPRATTDDRRLMRLIQASEDFDRLARARIFLDFFPRSALRPEALLIYGETAEAAAARLSREAARRLNQQEIAASDAPEISYYLNYAGLDRYNRQGIRFVFDHANKQFHYNGWAWREIVTRYPSSAVASKARERLAVLRRLRLIN